MNSLRIKNLIIGEGIPKIAVSITGKTEKEILDIINTIDKEKVEIVEWRADFFREILDQKRVLEVLKSIRELLVDIPIIFTFRRESESGETTISIDEYINLNKAVAKSKLVDLIDIEVFSINKETECLIEIIQKYGVYVIGSNHDFLKTPSKEEMIQRLKSIEETGADILKLAVMAKTSEDVLRLLDVTNSIKTLSKKQLIAISMGDLGTMSRISGEKFGSCITFAALDMASAPGQLSVDKLFEILNKIKQ